MALAAESLGDTTRAQRELGEAERIVPHDKEGYALLAVAFEKLGDQQRAGEYAELALHVAPTPEEAEWGFSRLVDAYYRVGRISDARRILREDLLPNWPDSLEGHYWQGRLQLLDGGNEAALSALQHLEHVLEVDAAHAPGRYQHGVCLARLGQLERARKSLEVAVSLSPQWAAAHHELSKVLRRLGCAELAREHLAIFQEIEAKRRRRNFLKTQMIIQRATSADLHELAQLELELDDPYAALATLKRLPALKQQQDEVAHLLAEAESRIRQQTRQGQSRSRPTTVKLQRFHSNENGQSDTKQEVTRPRHVGTQHRFATPLSFVDITSRAGLSFVHWHGGTGRHFYIETMVAGCAFLDYDADGWLDVFLVQGGALPGFPSPQTHTHALYRNMGNGTFVDVTVVSGIALKHYGIGCCLGDYDNDGDTDLFVTGLDKNLLLQNNGDGTFANNVEDHRLNAVAGMSMSPAFVDFDHDGNLDLIVCRYTNYDMETDPVCRNEAGQPAYCAPDVFSGTHSAALLNTGDGSFADVSESAGITSADARAMGLATADFNDDGRMDLYLTSDLIPNRMFLQQQESVFEELGAFHGAAYGSDGGVLSGMGVDCGDYDNDGRIDLVVNNFANEPSTLYRSHGDGIFEESSMASGLAQASLPYVCWGVQFVDFDLDGWQDLFIVCGHVDDHAQGRQPGQSYAQPCLLLRNQGGTFVDVSRTSGAFFSDKQVGRGASFGDVDNDGDVDVLIACNNGPAKLVRNDTPTSCGHVSIRLVGKQCNRDALGCRVRVRAEEMHQQTKWVKSGTSYLSDHDRRLVFGIGHAPEATVEVLWPCGNVQRSVAVANETTTIVENDRCGCASDTSERESPIGGALTSAEVVLGRE
jgi:tetratricopeptide (TPR) repeat protein